MVHGEAATIEQAAQCIWPVSTAPRPAISPQQRDPEDRLRLKGQ
jgi:hypothetical protein